MGVVAQVTPWLWYIARSSGILGFIFLWFAMFLGLAIRNPILKKAIKQIYSLSFHGFLAVMSAFWIIVHITVLLFHKEFPMSLADVLIPWHFHSNFLSTNFLALGIIAFYTMIILIITSYFRKHLKRWIWRIMHYLSPIAFLFVVFHGLFNGTDMKNPLISSAYLSSSIILIILYISNLIFSSVSKRKRKKL